MKRIYPILALLLAAMPVTAQDSGTVTGNVTSEGTGVGSAQVVLSQSVTGAQYGGLTNDSGRFNSGTTVA